MKLLFKFMGKDEVFLPNGINDLIVIQCTIQQKEAMCAEAHILTTGGLSLLKEALIGDVIQRRLQGVIGFFSKDTQETEILFRGFLEEAPSYQADQNGYVWSFVGCAGDPCEMAKALGEAMRADEEKKGFTSVFYDEVTLTELLEDKPYVPYMDPKTGQLGLSHVTKGSYHKVFTQDDVLQSSFRFSWGRPSWDQVTVQVRASFHQRCAGVFNAAPLIAKAFDQSNGYLHTLTPTVLIEGWPKVGEKIGMGQRMVDQTQGGYTVVKSQVRRLKGSQVSVLGLRPYTVPLPLRVNKVGEAEMTVMKRFRHGWFMAELWLQWHYVQPIVERVTFLEKNTGGHGGGRVRDLVFTVHGADDVLPCPSVGSLFQTQRGQAFLSYAKAVARNHLRTSKRRYEMVFEVPFERFWDVSLDTVVTVHHFALPFGVMTGKVVGFQMRCTSAGWTVWVRVLSDELLREKEGSVADESDRDQGFQLKRVQREGEEDAFQEEAFCGKDSDFIEKVEVFGDGMAQEAALISCSDAGAIDVARALKACPFSIQLTLKDLRGHAVRYVDWVGVPVLDDFKM